MIRFGYPTKSVGPAPPEAPAAAAAACDVRRTSSEPWSGVPDSAILAPGPVQVRLGAPAGRTGEPAVKNAESLLQGVRHTVTPATDGLVIDLPQPPARLELPYETLWETDTDQICLIYFGDAPVLAVLDPATGQETVLGPAPVTDAPLPDPWYGTPLHFTADALVVPGHEQVTEVGPGTGAGPDWARDRPNPAGWPTGSCC